MMQEAIVASGTLGVALKPDDAAQFIGELMRQDDDREATDGTAHDHRIVELKRPPDRPDPADIESL